MLSLLQEIAGDREKVKVNRINTLKHAAEFLGRYKIDFFNIDMLDNEIYLALSLRCYQIFIEYMQKNISNRDYITLLKNKANELKHLLLDINLDNAVYSCDLIPCEQIMYQSSFNMTAVDNTKYSNVIFVLKTCVQSAIKEHHSIDFHFNSFFTDFVLDCEIHNAEILIHENAHLFFNIFLESNKISLDNSNFYLKAPWKANVKRHEKGFLHGFFAFSAVLSFFISLESRENLNAKQQQYIHSYIMFRLSQINENIQMCQYIIKKYPKKLQDLFSIVVTHIKHITK